MPEPGISPVRDDNPTIDDVTTNANSNLTLFDKHLTVVYDINLSERKYLTEVQGYINEEIILSLNNIICEYISNKDLLTYFKVNCIHFAA